MKEILKLLRALDIRLAVIEKHLYARDVLTIEEAAAYMGVKTHEVRKLSKRKARRPKSYEASEEKNDVRRRDILNYLLRNEAAASPKSSPKERTLKSPLERG